MWLKWLPWRYVIKKVARARGFGDPIQLLAQLGKFAKPSEVLVPGELLRAGAVLQARGLINSQAIQHNLDWIWPYWVHRQFDPTDPSFIPRAFSLTHINLTQRNWTAVGIPGFSQMPVIDPRGLAMPFFDSWSIDACVISRGDKDLIPAKSSTVLQKLIFSEGLAVCTEAENNFFHLTSTARVMLRKDSPHLIITLSARSKSDAGWLTASVRPCNPEGVSFIHAMHILPDDEGLEVNGEESLSLHPRPDKYMFSDYHRGDVYTHIHDTAENQQDVSCSIGMATAAALYRLEEDSQRECTVCIPLEDTRQPKKTTKAAYTNGSEQWNQMLHGTCRLNIPDKRLQFLFDAALRTIVLHSSNETMYAGPYTYKRFWIRDAAFAAYALMRAGCFKPVDLIIEQMLHSQENSGYFVSQRGEWDSNGQVLWILQQRCSLDAVKPKRNWLSPARRAFGWIRKKRLHNGKELHSGLLPPGFSAEHLGPNDYYYWDDFWTVAGLQSGSLLMRELGNTADAAAFANEAENLMQAINCSLDMVFHSIGSRAVPASPYRRLDSGAIGSLIAGYPLQLYGPNDTRMLETAVFLMRNCLIENAFFHDIVHSGINPYLTLHLAQVLLRAGDMQALKLMDAIAGLASSTGQWPEAIHPGLKSGCMGDGQHVWAASEWVLMLCNCFVREETADRTLILCSGIPQKWYTRPCTLRMGPIRTSLGPVEVSLVSEQQNLTIHWEGRWYGTEPKIIVALPGRQSIKPPPGKTSCTLQIDGS